MYPYSKEEQQEPGFIYSGIFSAYLSIVRESSEALPPLRYIGYAVPPLAVPQYLADNPAAARIVSTILRFVPEYGTILGSAGGAGVISGPLFMKGKKMKGSFSPLKILEHEFELAIEQMVKEAAQKFVAGVFGLKPGSAMSAAGQASTSPVLSLTTSGEVRYVYYKNADGSTVLRLVPSGVNVPAQITNTSVLTPEQWDQMVLGQPITGAIATYSGVSGGAGTTTGTTTSGTTGTTGTTSDTGGGGLVNDLLGLLGLRQDDTPRGFSVAP